ncbi:hypothetical protein NIES593_20400 [Hydrococcus rivularis NIES-593]|uniref:Biotin carboxylase n=1 Tax=Hydrococcus rivularis NIES-593 TaxID=1921803 RepID=A0A1U7H8R2_9CYAN|nr:hypothetical protein [Hydrococcus rivularis]OKH19830.1 hypothetical protein NIES593_20400 [Hydrococcus rivularis NIES-593]
MGFRALTVIVVSGLLWIFSWIATPAALALTQIQLFDISYTDCPPEFAEGNVTSGGSSSPANCFMITGKAKNPSGKTVYDADVFGRIYDANGEPALQNRGRIGSIPEVPPGISNFEVRISVPANQPTPLKLEQFKASGFSGSVRPNIQRFD